MDQHWQTPRIRQTKTIRTRDAFREQLAITVIARWERAVRSQHMDVLSEDNTLGEQKTVFGDFLSSNKKLPAGRRTAEALALAQKIKREVTGFRLSPE
jgi:hypothetical protein